MAKFNPEDYRVNNNSQKFDQEKYRVKSDDGPFVGMSAVRNLAQGIAAGGSDELAGGVEAVGRVISLKGLGGPIKNISIDENGPTLNANDIKKAYQMGRDQERESLKIDMEKNPGTSITSNVIGGLISPANKITQGMSAVKSGAALGAVYGYNASDAEYTVDNVIDAGKGSLVGAGIGKGFDKISKSIAPKTAEIAEIINPTVIKKNTDEIIKSADRLGIKLTPAMLDDTGFVERLESSLSKSPSIMGRSLAKKISNVNQKLRESVSELTKDATNLKDYQVGEKFKTGVNSAISERLDPISSVFDEVAQSTKFIPVSDRSKNAIMNNITKTDAYSLSGGIGKPSQYVDMIGRVQNADQVKTVMTMLNADIKAAQGAEKQVLIGIKNKLSTLEENSITRAAIQQAREGGMRQSTGAKIGSGIVNDLRDARSGYRSLSNDLGELAENARIKTSKGPSAFLDSVESIPSERIQDKFFNTENFRSLSNLKEKFPEQFNLLRQGKLREIFESSVDNSINGQGNVSTQKFLNQVRGLTPEARKILFNESDSVIDDITNIQRALPRNFNPSGTASEMGWQDAIIRNVRDIPNYLLYKGASTNLGNKIGSSIQNIDTNGIRDVTATATKKISVPVSKYFSELQSTKTNLRGVEKWALDGSVKLESNGIDKETIENLNKSNKGRDLLIKASDLKPGSKAMDKIVGEIQNFNSGGN